MQSVDYHLSFSKDDNLGKRRGSLAVSNGDASPCKTVRGSRRNSVVSVADEMNRIKTDKAESEQSRMQRVMQSMKGLWSKPRANVAQFFREKKKVERLSDARSSFGGVDNLDANLERLPSFMKKLFGEQFHTQRMILQIEEASSFLIHPYSPFRQYWDIFMLINLLFLVITLPYRLSYGAESAMNVTVGEPSLPCLPVYSICCGLLTCALVSVCYQRRLAFSSSAAGKATVL